MKHPSLAFLPALFHFLSLCLLGSLPTSMTGVKILLSGSAFRGTQPKTTSHRQREIALGLAGSTLGFLVTQELVPRHGWDASGESQPWRREN